MIMIGGDGIQYEIVRHRTWRGKKEMKKIVITVFICKGSIPGNIRTK